MKIETVLKNIRKDLEKSDHFFQGEIEEILSIVQKRIKRYAKGKKKPKKKAPVIKDSWFIP